MKKNNNQVTLITLVSNCFGKLVVLVFIVFFQSFFSQIFIAKGCTIYVSDNSIISIDSTTYNTHKAKVLNIENVRSRSKFEQSLNQSKKKLAKDHTNEDMHKNISKKQLSLIRIVSRSSTTFSMNISNLKTATVPTIDHLAISTKHACSINTILKIPEKKETLNSFKFYFNLDLFNYSIRPPPQKFSFSIFS